MTLSLSIERTPPQDTPPAPAARVPSHAEAFDLAGLAGDATARAADDGRRRLLACGRLPAVATPALCVAAWHAVLHWLGYSDEPVASGLVGRRADAGWPIVTQAGAQTPLAALKASVEAQWPRDGEAWPGLGDPAHGGLADVLRCQTVRLEPGPEAQAPELALRREADGGWQLVCAASRYGEEFQRVLMALWQRFVVAMATRPQALLSDASLAEGLGGGTLHGPLAPMDGGLLQRFDDAVRSAPQRTAVVDDQGRITYAALDALAAAWAEALRAAGARAGDLVGLAFGRAAGHRMVAAQLAVLKAGAAFVPIDAGQPAARLQGIADDTGMRLVLAERAALAALRDALPAVRCLDAEALPQQPAAPVPAPAQPLDATAYVIFTSGSTGQPKGVKVSHGNLLNFVAHMAAHIGAGEVVSQFAPFTFDASVAEIHASVLNAATLLVLGSALIDDPVRLQATMTAEGVSFAAFPPQYAQHLSPEALPTLRTLLTAGSAPDHALIARWQPRVCYLNGYGPTETTILSTAWQPAAVPAPHEPIVIGAPIRNTAVRVANRFGQALPHGVVGELLIGGEGVAHGYLNREALTRDRFVALDGLRWYRSGDLASLDADGRLVFAGRVDSQIKLRGHRLEPGEVEAALLAVDGVKQAAVALAGNGHARQLVAFCGGERRDDDTLRAELLQRLPAWALPNRFVWIEQLPVTRNGKTDYARLVADFARAAAEAELPAVEHGDTLQAQVAAIWGEVLQQRRVGPDDHFIHLGGDSLTALVVASAVRRLGYALPASALLQHPRLADYVQRLRAQGTTAVAEDHAEWTGSAPLAPIHGWFFSLGLAHPGRFCQTLAFDSDARIDTARLAAACAELARHHDQLRARFEPDGAGGWRQHVAAAPIVLPPVNEIEIADALIDATSEAYCRRLADELRIDAAPLFRLAVIHSPKRSRVVWVLHHLVVDTVSHGLLLDDLQQLYHAPGRAAHEVLPGKSLAFAAWSDALLQRVEADAAATLAPWLPRIAEVSAAPALPLLAARTEGAPEVVCEARLVPAETRRLVEQATRCYRQSPEELVLAATCRALAQVFGLDRVAIDIEWHGRDESAGVERTVGWFTSVHPLAVAVTPGEALGPWLVALKEARAAIPQRGRAFYALRYLSRDPQVRAAFANYRAPQVLFNFSGVAQRGADGWRTAPVAVLETGEGNANPYALSVETELRDGALVVACHSRAALWPEGAAQRLGQALSQALADIVRHCSDATQRRWTPSDFPLLALTQADADALPAGCRAAFPLTDMQQTMWRHHETYQVVMAHRLPRRFDAGRWIRAVDEWIERHDCLRSFVRPLADGSACQVVLDALAAPVEVHRAEAGGAQALADELVEQARRAPVVVERAPLFGVQAVHDGGDAFVVVLSIHHLIHDGWSIELLLNDLFATYRRLGGEAVARPAAPLAGIADVVALQRRLQADPALQAHWAALPWDGGACRLPVTVRDAAGDGSAAPRDMRLHLGRLDDGLVRQVRARAHALGVTVNSLWLAGYAALLRLLGGSTQVRCGVIQSGRSDEIAGIETLTGCCVNTLPLVLQMPPSQTLAQTAAQVDAQLRQMRAAAVYPLSAIHAQVRTRLDDGELFGTLFNIESHRYGQAADADRPELLGGFESTNHALIFGLIEQAGREPGTLRYDVRIGFDAARHDAASVAGWLQLYEHLMGLLTQRAELPWEALPLLPKAVHEQVVVGWNRTGHRYRDDACVHELVAEQAARTPDATALVFESQQLTFRALDDRANRLARHLQALGVGPQTVVGCCFERSIEMVVALLGVLKAGGAYVPLDPELPAQRIAAMVADVGTTLVLTHGALPQGPLAALAPAVRLVRLDADAAAIDARSSDALVSGNCPSDLAYVIFTSGSTGKPKAAMNEHGALVNRIQWQQHAYPIGAADRVLQKTPFSFDVSVWEFFWPLMTGATLVVARPGGHRDPAYLGALVRAQGITTLHFVPSMLEAFVDAGELAGCTSLRQVITSGEGLPGTLAARFLAQSAAKLHNLYGPTEAAIDVSHYTVARAGSGTEPIGRPIWNTRLYVLDERLRPLPPGVCGELYIGGLAVGRGYLGRPELTAERFIASPFVAGERLYRTGDLARFRADGEIEYLGRTDHQVKIRGLRIELGEIEHAIASHPAVRQAVVTVHEEGGRKQLVGHVLRRSAGDDADALVAALQEGLQAALPEYMVPSAFVVLDTLPLNANGKVDRARLPAPAATPAGPVAEPQTPTERTLLGIWQAVLGLERIGVTDGFFALGGDSILAIQVAARAVKQGLAVQPRHVIEDKTIRRLAARLAPAAPVAAPVVVDAALAGLDAARLAALQAAHPALELVYPCTGMQQAMLLHSAREPGQGLYISQLRITLDGADTARLQRAWALLVRRHAVLRTAFVDAGGDRLLQLVMGAVELPWRELDLRADPAALDACLEDERLRPFAADQAPLMRLLLVRTGDTTQVLAWSYHHALIDGWAMGTLMQELVQAYADPQAAEAAPAAPAYRDYIAWLAAQDGAQAAAYWRRHFDGVAAGAAAELPAEVLRPTPADRPAVDAREQRLVTLALPAPLTTRLQRMARGEGVGPATVMLAAWGLLMAKYNGQPQVLFGYASSGRPHALPGVEQMAGLFINSLPLCLAIDGAQTLGDWLAAIQRVQLDHEDHGFLPLADIQRAVGVPPVQPLFDSLVVVENFPLDRAALAGQGANALPVRDVQGSGRDGFGLTLVVYPGESLRLDLVYQPAKVGDAAAATMLARLGRLLEGFADGGGQPLGGLTMLSADERARALGAWNDTQRPYPSAAPVTALFAAQADVRAEAPALVAPDGAWSYAELARRAAAIAGWLRAQGVRRGDRVALSMDKEPALVAAMLGILRCGAAYVPVAVDCPAERRAFIAADAGIRHVVTRAALAAQVTLPEVTTLAIDDAPAQPAHEVPDDADAEATAYVIYTSGTTGTPKGVAVSHRNLVNFCCWSTDAARCGPGDRVTQFAPYTFDASAGEIFGTLISGAELHLLPGALIQDPRALTHYLCEQGIRFAAFPPSYAQHIDPTAVPETLSLLTAGSAPAPELVQRWGSRRRYLNGYGPTETTILSSAWVCEPGAIDGRGLSIGRPIANTTIYVVDTLGQLCAPGLVGEIWIGGDGVAQGYVNRPELTAKQFIADPFRAGGRVYRTGDLGRWRDDGCIEFVGRRDRQVKLRGFRIELGEIEARLGEHPQVAEAAVLVRGEGEAQQLIAWIVPSSGTTEGRADALRAFLRQTLPEYMLPQAFVELERMPLGVNGKVDEKALPMPVLAAGAGIVAPRTETEARLAQVWAAVLKLDVDAIGVQSHFFELGGHSLLAMRVAARLQDEHGLAVGVADVFTHPVLADLAAHLARLTPQALPPIEPAPRDAALPLSYAQRRLWFLDQIEGASQAYQVPGLLRLRGALDEAALRAALQALVDRHEVLRTTYAADGGEPVQRIGAAGRPFTLQLHDLAARPDAEAAAQALLAAALDTPFDLARGPLIRGTLLRVGADEHLLLIAMHHIATDGWSLALLLQELAALYGAFADGRPDPLPPLALQYADYAAWQQQWQGGVLWQAQCAHWQAALADAPPLLDLPTDRPRPARQDYAGATLRFTLDAATRDGLVALGQRHGSTLFMTVLAAWSVVLARLSGQNDLVVGTPVANRARLETEPMVGFFVNLLALRLDLTGAPTLAQLLQRVRERVLDGQRHQQLPFEQVVDLVQPPRSLAHTPLFQVMLNWQERSLEGFALPGLRTEALAPAATQSKYDLTLDIGEEGDGIVGTFEYATALFDEATVRRHAGYLQRVIAAMLADADQPAQAVDLLGDDERRLLAGFNDSARPELLARCWQDLFDAQAARTPQRTAVRCDGQSLDYAELQRRATRRAARLAARGAGPGEVVALLDERGIELLVSIVAVLKTGAAYLPLDPAHPPQRWLEVLQQAAPRLLCVGDGLATDAAWLCSHWQAERVVGIAELRPQAGDDDFVPARAPAPDDLAYVLFTSGSTGTPKGVQIEQRGLVNNILAKREPLGLGADDVIAQTASQCFDISVWQFLGALLFGARVLIVRSALTRDPAALLAHLAAEGVTVWEPVPSVMQAALDAPRPLPALRWVMPTGEALSRELVARWFAQYPAIPLMNAYGPAECADDVALQPMHAPVERVLIGRPVANARLHVVDERLQRLPLGAVGELAVSGPVVGRGYVGRPEETAAAFRANPFATGADDQRLYLTGDLVRRTADGGLEYIGRKDFQVKLRGFRIELGEVEAGLATHPAVREAVAAVLAHGEAGPQLVAWVVAAAGTPVQALEQHLAARLPDYMRPSAIVRLDTLPRNANGKVDRRRLPAPGEDDLVRAAYEAPRTDTERALAGVWQSLLQVSRVGRDDSFFDLGGHSLLLVRMLAQLAPLGLELGLAEVYQRRTLAGCAEAIDGRRRGAAAWPLGDAWRHRIVPLGDGRSVLLLDAAERPRHAELQALLADVPAAERPRFVRYADDVAALACRIHAHGPNALAGGDGDAGAVHDPVRALRRQARAHLHAIERAPVDAVVGYSPIQRNLMGWQQRDSLDIVALAGWHTPAALQQAFAAVAAEQDMLRAVPGAEPAQWCLLDAAAIAAAPVPVIDLRAVPVDGQEALVRRLADELMALRRRSPLPYAPAIVSLDDLDHRVLMAVDHLVWDGLSAEALRQRLQQHLAGTAVPPPHGYREHAAAAWRAPTPSVADTLDAEFDRAALVAATQQTQRALAGRASQPLRSLRLRVPLSADGGTPAEQAFAGLRRALRRLTGLDHHGVLLNHHGRHAGGTAWFDVVGPFLDKVPFVVGDDTPLAPLVAQLGRLQALGVHFLGLAQAPGSAWAGALPPLADEVLFNFLGDMPPPSAVPDEGMLMDRLQEFRGVLFEAAADGDALALHCVFRGNAGEVAALRDAIGGAAAAGAPARGQAAAAAHSLEVRDVHKRYGDFHAVRGVSFSVREGCCFGILGPNGAGKTSLLAMIEGLVPITSGSIRLLGMDVATEIQRIQPRLGVQLQQNNYFQFLTVTELLRFYQDLRAAVGGKRTARPVAPLLERLNLQDKLNAKVDELSGGQKQRLSIAIALLEDPDVIFLDEPTSALDPHSRIATWEFIEDLKRDPRKTIILTTHYMEEAERLCDEILLMDKGRVIAQGAPAQLIQQLAARQTLHFEFGRGQLPADALARLRTAHEAEWDARSGRLTLTTANVTDATRDVLALSQSERLALVNIEINRPTLEQVFLSRTGQELTS